MYLDSANLQEINAAYQTNLFLGVTTNPTILWKEKQPRFAQLKKISALNVGELFCQVIGESLTERYEDYLRIKAFTDHISMPIIVKVPIDTIGLELIKKIKLHDSRQKILATAIYSSSQAILSAIAGCDSIAPYVNRMARNGIDPFQEIHHIRHFIDDRNLHTKIIAASFKESSQAVQALSAGAHTITVSYDVFQNMASSTLVSDALAAFEQHAKEYPDTKI